MITLHGFPFSNYYNIVKHVLMYKQVPFVEELTYGGGDEWLAISPLGKIPGLTTANGEHLSESAVICEYLEQVCPEPALYPQDPWRAARVRQISKIAELYLELPCRRLIAFSFQGKTPPDALQAEVRQVVERGIGAMGRVCQFTPYLAGGEMTMADIYVRYVNSVVKMMGGSMLDWDILADIPGMTEWDARMADSDIARKIDADQAANADEFFAYVKASFAG
jgi:glutathione S-transferase